MHLFTGRLVRVRFVMVCYLLVFSKSSFSFISVIGGFSQKLNLYPAGMDVARLTSCHVVAKLENDRRGRMDCIVALRRAFDGRKACIAMAAFWGRG